MEAGSEILGYEPAGYDVSTTDKSLEHQTLKAVEAMEYDGYPPRTGTVESHRADAHATQIARPFTAAQEMMSEVDEAEGGRGGPENDYENEFKEVQGNGGLYYKIHRENPMQAYQSSLYKLLPRTNLMKCNVVTKKALTSSEELAEYKFALQVPFCEQGKRKQVF